MVRPEQHFFGANLCSVSEISSSDLPTLAKGNPSDHELLLNGVMPFNSSM